MIPLALIMLLAGAPVAESPAPSEAEAIMWADYAPCGLVSLYLICQLEEKPVSWQKVKELVGTPNPEGELNFANLVVAASQLGIHPVGLDVGREALNGLPTPAIIQVHDARYPKELPHFLVLLRPDTDGVWLLDAPYAAYFLPEDRFQQSWTGKILIFARNEQEAQRIRDLAQTSIAFQWMAWGFIVSGITLLPISGLIAWARRSQDRNTQVAEAVNSRLHHGSPQLFQRRTLSIAVLSLFLIGIVTLVVFFSTSHRDKDIPPRCEFNGQVMELGELAPGEHKIHVPISNTGNHPLHITHVVSSCTCCAIVKNLGPIEPKQNATLEVNLTVIPGPRNVQLTVQSNDPEGEKHILLSWHGKAKPTLSPRWIESTNVPLDRPYERTIRLTYPGGKSALVPHLKSFECNRRGVEIREGRNDPLATKFTTSGLLTNILGEMELHLRIQPTNKPEHLQTICKLFLSYGKDIQTLNLPLIISFAGGQLAPDVSSVTFSAVQGRELLSQERLVTVADDDPRGLIDVGDLPNWLTCEIQRKSERGHLLRLKVVSVPPVLPVQHTLHITRKGATLPKSALRVNVLGNNTY